MQVSFPGAGDCIGSKEDVAVRMENNSNNHSNDSSSSSSTTTTTTNDNDNHHNNDNATHNNDTTNNNKHNTQITNRYTEGNVLGTQLGCVSACIYYGRRAARFSLDSYIALVRSASCEQKRYNEGT